MAFKEVGEGRQGHSKSLVSDAVCEAGGVVGEWGVRPSSSIGGVLWTRLAC